MQEVESRLRNWGRSVGVVIPKKIIDQEKLKEGDEVKLFLIKKNNVLNETFGKFKLKSSTDAILKEIDEEGWNE
ncbi:AbrB/MazE/SpoVT family DNA-binding domain-containing protein [archaeon]|nr:AbrB/MazE/SpoVT family DNA-binding domain-containing protein [archaeon]